MQSRLTHALAITFFIGAPLLDGGASELLVVFAFVGVFLWLLDDHDREVSLFRRAALAKEGK